MHWYLKPLPPPPKKKSTGISVIIITYTSLQGLTAAFALLMDLLIDVLALLRILMDLDSILVMLFLTS